MSINMYDVAKKSGMSHVTVSRVINNSPTVRSHNREKVLKAMAELGYYPNAAARSLASGKTGIIGCITPNLKDDFFSDVVLSIDKVIAEHGYFLAISVLNDAQEREKAVSNFLLNENRVDGLIILTPLFENSYISEAKSLNIPLVLLDNQEENVNANFIQVDNYAGGAAVANHLIELGHRKIGYIGAPEIFLSVRRREAGFMETLRSAGVESCLFDRGEFDVASGYNITSRWIERGKLPTAIAAADDFIAFGVIDALREHGYSVPNDISVCGFDDHFLCSQLHPMLTTVRQPASEMGKRAVETIIQSIEGKLSNTVSLQLMPEFIERESTGSPKTERII